MFTAKVYRIMVGSLSGAMEEVYIAKETIRKWNQQNAERTGKVLMPIEWDTTPEAIQSLDVVVGVIDNWIDNPKCFEDCIEAGKQGMLFFNSFNNPANTIPGELNNVRLLFNRLQKLCYCTYYNGLSELSCLLNKRLDIVE